MADDIKTDDKTVDDKEPVEGQQLGPDASDADAESDQGNPQAPSDQPVKEDDKSKEAGEAEDTQEDKTDDKADDKTDDTDDKTSDELDTTVWGSTGDEVGDSVLLVLQNSGISVEDAKALIYNPLTEHGDPTKLNKNALIEKVGKANANLVLAGIENFVSKNNTKNEAVLKDVYEIAGGKDNWEQVAPWAREKLSEADRKDYADMLDAGGAKAKFAAHEIIRLYNADTNNTSIGKTTTLEGESPAGDQGEAITRIEYAERMDKLYRTGKASKAAIAEVQRARERGRKKGI